MLADVVMSVLLGVALGMLGRWGTRNAHLSAPGTLPEPERKERERVLKRGAVACQLLGAVFVLAGSLRPLL